MTDDLETVLGPPASGAETNRAALLAASTRIVRRRFVLRRVGSWASVSAVFALGGVAGWVVKPTPVEREVVTIVIPPSQTPPAEVAPSHSPQSVALTPAELELKAELSDDPTEVAQLYREAGDKYLAGSRDYAQAARCYRLHLDAAGADVRQISTGDSWLLMSMKTTPR